MKILLIGEYSGFHRNLAYGLKSHGHVVEVAGYRDGWKQIPVDFDFGQQGRGIKSIIGRARNIPSHLFFSNYVEKFDVVQFINPVIFPTQFNYNNIIMKRILKINTPKVLIAAGDDAYTWHISRKLMKYHPWDAWVAEDLRLTDLNKLYCATNRALAWSQFVVENVNAIIPVMYEYDIAYQWAKNKFPVIPLPLIIDEIEYSRNTRNGDLKIFHGLNRPGFKGTALVSAAFEILRKKYINYNVSFTIDGKMPYNTYINYMKNVNIVIDQVRSYSHGLNGLIAMASGKIVLGGSEPQSLAYYDKKISPAINVIPDVNDIVKKISFLIDSNIDLQLHGELSRQFVIDNHDALKISKKYLNVYKTIS